VCVCVRVFLRAISLSLNFQILFSSLSFLSSRFHTSISLSALHFPPRSVLSSVNGFDRILIRSGELFRILSIKQPYPTTHFKFFPFYFGSVMTLLDCAMQNLRYDFSFLQSFSLFLFYVSFFLPVLRPLFFFFGFWGSKN
jgi:hypothetical protein